MRVSAPPFINPCYFGTDISDRDTLVAANHTLEGTAGIIGVDSLGYLSVDNVFNLTNHPVGGLCAGCFTGVYPAEIPPDSAERCLGYARLNHKYTQRNAEG
jgi:amidophosphoribosyltransferase